MISKRRLFGHAKDADLRALARLSILALSGCVLSACLPRYAMRANAPRARAADTERTQALKRVGLWVSEDVLLTGEITEDEIPGNVLRRRRVKQLPDALRDALARAGFAGVTTDESKPHELSCRLHARLGLAPDNVSEYAGTRYVFEGVTTLMVERGGRLVDAIEVHLPLADVDAKASPRRSGALVDWRSYPEEVAKLLVDALASSARVASALESAPDRGRPEPKETRPAPKLGLDDPDMMAVLQSGPTISGMPAGDPRLAPKAERRAAPKEQEPAEAIDYRPTLPSPELAVTRRTGSTADVKARELAPAKHDPKMPEPAPVTLSFGDEPERSGPATEAIAVFDIEDASHSFASDVLEQLGVYLAAQVTDMLGRPVVPPEELRTRLIAEKSKGYRDCTDQRCQVALGRALAAKKSISTKLLRVGATCAITLSLYDLETELAERATSIRSSCDEQALLLGLDRAVERLARSSEAPTSGANVPRPR